MKVLIDTNVAIRNFIENDPRHAAINACLRSLIQRGSELCILPQVLYESWVVATRPQDKNGLGLDPAAAAQLLDRMIAGFTLLEEPADLLSRWRALCVTHNVRGVRAHDARLAAAMLAAGIETVVTENTSDFHQFEGLQTLNPAANQ